MAVKENIQKWLQDNVLSMGFFPVEVDISPRRVISVFIDGMQGINVNDCAVISRRISDDFGDKLNGYSLIVSSPGLDRPLTHQQQFAKSIGRDVIVVMKDGTDNKGRLESYTAADITLKIPAISKKESPQDIIIPYDQIKEVKLVISFK